LPDEVGKVRVHKLSSPSMGEDEGEGDSISPLTLTLSRQGREDNIYFLSLDGRTNEDPDRVGNEDPDEVGKVRVHKLSSPSMGED